MESIEVIAMTAHELLEYELDNFDRKVCEGMAGMLAATDFSIPELLKLSGILENIIKKYDIDPKNLTHINLAVKLK